MKNKRMWLDKNIERLERNIPTDFLEENELKQLLGASRKIKLPVQVFELFSGSDKKILYLKDKPSVTCYQIICNNTLSHREVLGSLFSHQILPHTFGDIVIKDGNAYFVILASLKQYFTDFFTHIGNMPIKLKEVDQTIFEGYQYPYEEITIIVPSMRLDNVLSKLCKTSRKIVQDKLDSDEVRINGDIINKPSFQLNEQDSISVRRVGKFRYLGIVQETKKQNTVLSFQHYLS